MNREKDKIAQNIFRNKIQEHDFGYNDASWEKMNDMLDNKSISNLSKFNFKKVAGIFAAVLLSISLISYLFQNLLTEKRTSIYDELSTDTQLFNDYHSFEKLYLHLDKTFCKPSEDIWFTAYLNDAENHLPSLKSDVIYVELIAPNGNTKKKLRLKTINGTTKGNFTIDKNWEGGIYKIKAYTSWQLNVGDLFERKIQVQKSVLPNLRMELDYARKSYGGGDEVIADIQINTLSNQPLKNHEILFDVKIEGQVFHHLSAGTNAKGKAKLKFELPDTLNSNDGLLNVQIFHNGQNESISRSIPIILNKIDLQFFPESGNLMANNKSKIAFKAINEFGKPADVEGIILNRKGDTLQIFKSYHFGMGSFDFQPEFGENYFAKITKPTGINEKYRLPKSSKKGMSFSIKEFDNEEVVINVYNPNKILGEAIIHSQGTIYESQKIDSIEQGKLSFSIKDLPIGLVQITLFDRKKIPHAERLIFLNPHKKLIAKLSTDKEKYLPGEEVTLDIDIKNERGKPVAGNFSLAVCDDKLLSFADDKQGHILSYLLLESELKGEIFEPNFYFEEDKTKRPEIDRKLALDNLLLTQGWRKFNWEKVTNRIYAEIKYFEENSNVSGIVVDANSKPIKNALVKFKNSSQKMVTNAKGEFFFSEIYQSPNFQPKLIIRKNGFQTIVDVSGNAQNIVVTLPLNKIVSKENVELIFTKKTHGAIFGNDIVGPIFYTDISIRGCRSATSNISGNYNFKGDLHPGIYEVIIHHMDYSTFSKIIEVIDSDEYKRVNFMLEVKKGEELVNQNLKLIAENTSNYRKESARKAITDSLMTHNWMVPYPKENKRGNSKMPRTWSAADVKKIKKKAKNNRKNNAKSNDFNNIEKTEAIAEVTIPLNENISISDDEENSIAVSSNTFATFDIAVSDVTLNAFNTNSDANFIINVPDQGVFAFQDLALSLPNSDLTTRGDFSVTKKDIQKFSKTKEFYVPKYKVKDSTTRTDFRNTIYWNPKIQTNKNGKATVQFFTSDAITTFRATLEGIGNNGKIGRAEHYFYNQPELGLQIKVPTNMVTGDLVKIPVTISNNSENLMEGDLTQFLPKGMATLGAVANPPSGFSKGEKPFGGLETAPKVAVALAAKESKTIFLNYQIENNAESGNFGLRFETQNGEKDELFQPISINSRGFPVEEVFGGSSLEETFDVPIINPVEGSLNATFTVYPNVVGEVLEGMERMLRQPTGCFEQTSSANYPNVLVLNYLQEVGADMPEAEKRAMEYLEKGYKRLLGFEVTGGGFDWYGKPPAHEGLTAYGLMEFVDMSKVFQVESDLIERTAKWLLSRRNGNGGWQRSTKKAYRFNAQGIGDTYICWAMSEAGFGRKIQKEIEVAFENAMESEDPYLMGLMLNVLENEKSSNSKIAALKSKLIQLQNEDGSWTGKTTSIMNSRGRGLTIETTSLVTLGLLKDFENNRFYIKNVIKFIQKSKTGHGFGSTQSTILAMKTLIEYAKFSKSYNEGGEIALIINGEKVEAKSYRSNQNGKLIFENLDQFLRKENNKVRVKFSKTKKALTYDLAISYATRQPANSEKCLVDLETKLQNKSIKMGETARFSTIIKNTHDEPIPNTIAIVGIPAGLSLQPWQLKEMQEKALFDYYEIMPNGNIVFHFRDMEAAEKVEINLDLKADIPGVFEAPASSAYLYYWNEEQVWSKPERVEIIQ